MVPDTASSPPPVRRLDRRGWAVLLVLCGAMFLEGIDVSMMGVALPSIREEFDLSTSAVQWVVSAYVVGYGGFVLLGGRAADLLGRRRMFLLWLGVFVAFSGLGGLATEGWMVILARFVTGVAAGFMTPAALSIITTSFAEGPDRNRALLVYAGTGAAGFSFGLVAGGLLTAIDWRWTFFAPVLLAAALLVVAPRVLPRAERPATPARGRFDVAGAGTVTLAALALVLGVVRAPDVDVAITLATLTAAAVLLAAFVRIERRSPAPLVRFGLLRSAPLVRANAGTMLFLGSFIGFQFIAVLYLQELRGWSPVETGLALLVVATDAILAPTITPWLVARFGNGRVLFSGMLTAVAAYALFLRVGPDWTYAAMLPTFVLIGIAFALAYGPLMIMATEGVSDDEQGLAGGLFNVSAQFGAALGLAVVAAVNVAATSDGSPDALLDGYRAALVVPVVATALGALVAGFGLRTRRLQPAGAPAG